MPASPQDLPSPDPDLKLSWEIRKLQAEAATLHRPFRNPSVVAALMTSSIVALVSLAGFTLQWARSDREYTLAQIKTQKLDLEAALLEKRRSTLDADVASRTAQLEKITLQLNETGAALQKKALTNAQLEDTQARLRDAAAQLKAVSKPGVLSSVGMTGFLFLGDFDDESGSWTQYMVVDADSGAKPSTAPGSFAQEQRFALRYLMALRESLPPNTPEYFRAVPEVTTLAEGTVVSIRSPPVRIRRGNRSQYWAKVTVH